MLLIVITVAAAVVTYTFVMGFVGTGTAATGAAQGQLSYDSFSVEPRTGGKSNITIYLRNIGGKAVVLNAVYVDGEAYAYESDKNNLGDKEWTLCDTGGTVSVGQLGILIIYSDKPAAQSQLVCSDGTTLSLSVRK